MRLLGIALVVSAALTIPAWAGETEDAAYQAAAALAMKDPASADYVKIRTLYAVSKYYKGSASDPYEIMPYHVVTGPPAPQAMKDEAKLLLQAHYAQPIVHTSFANVMGYRQGMPEWAKTRAAVQDH